SIHRSVTLRTPRAQASKAIRQPSASITSAPGSPTAHARFTAAMSYRPSCSSDNRVSACQSGRLSVRAGWVAVADMSRVPAVWHKDLTERTRDRKQKARGTGDSMCPTSILRRLAGGAAEANAIDHLLRPLGHELQLAVDRDELPALVDPRLRLLHTERVDAGR